MIVTTYLMYWFGWTN